MPDTPRPLWTIRIPLSSSDRLKLKQFGTQYEVTVPELLGALLRVILEQGSLHSLLAGSTFPKRYSRNSEVVEVASRQTSKILQELGTEVYVKPGAAGGSPRAYLEKLKEAPQRPVEASGDSPSPAEAPLAQKSASASSEPRDMPRVLRELGVPLPSSPDPELALPPPVPKLRVISKDTTPRDSSLGEVLSLIAYPGLNLDAECEHALEAWKAQWGDLGDGELLRLAGARQQRAAAYVQWQEQHAALSKRQVTAEGIAANTPDPRKLRKREREVARARSALRAFEAKTRWELRGFEQTPAYVNKRPQK